MVDTLSKSERSRNMAQVRGVNTTPERVVRSFLRAQGFRIRSHVRYLPGKPDIVIPEFRTAIFVNGCFWHHHVGCKRSTLPSTKRQFWERKILGNAVRDRRVKRELRKSGWNVCTVWQCELSKSRIARRLEALVKRLRYRAGQARLGRTVALLSPLSF